jgi:prevent-host-death family protein
VGTISALWFKFGLSGPVILESDRKLPPNPLDKMPPQWYNMACLANIANSERPMTTRTIPSTDAQNNFGRVLDDVIQNDTRYVIKRRNSPQAILLSLSDFERLLAASDRERTDLGHVIRDLSPVYTLGETVDSR